MVNTSPASDRPSPPKRPRGRPAAGSGDDTRALVLTSARRLFADSGYSRTSMEGIASDAGVTARSVYHYFTSKRELFLAAADAALVRFGEEIVAQVFVHDDLRSRVHGFLDVFRTLYAEDPCLVSFLSTAFVEAQYDPTLGSNSTSGDGDEVTDRLLENALPLRTLMEVIIDGAIERHEVRAGVDRDGLITLFETLGSGINVSAGIPHHDFLRMLDELGHLIDGTLLLDP